MLISTFISVSVFVIFVLCNIGIQGEGLSKKAKTLLEQSARQNQGLEN